MIFKNMMPSLKAGIDNCYKKLYKIVQKRFTKFTRKHLKKSLTNLFSKKFSECNSEKLPLKGCKNTVILYLTVLKSKIF